MKWQDVTEAQVMELIKTKTGELNISKVRKTQKRQIYHGRLRNICDFPSEIPLEKFIFRLQKFVAEFTSEHTPNNPRAYFTYYIDDDDATDYGYHDVHYALHLNIYINTPETDDEVIIRHKKYIASSTNAAKTRKKKRKEKEQAEYKKYLKLKEKYGGEGKN